jgi:hypothetical protein
MHKVKIKKKKEPLSGEEIDLEKENERKQKSHFSCKQLNEVVLICLLVHPRPKLVATCDSVRETGCKYTMK